MENKVKVKDDDGADDSDDTEENDNRKKQRDEVEDMVRKVRFNLEILIIIWSVHK